MQTDLHNPFKKSKFIYNLNVDWVLLVGILILFALSLLILYSSSQSSLIIVKKQAIRLGIAAALMLIVAQIPPRIFKSWSTWLYLASLITLALVLFMGHSSKGAQRWLNLGIIKFQPAELMKIALPLLLAKLFSTHILPPKIKLLILPSICILIPVILIALQPDLGTAILVASAGVFIIFFAGMHWKLIVTIIVSTIISAPILWKFLHTYQRERILTLFNPDRDPLGSGYHIIQSKIAIGSGGLYGKGWLNGTQSQLEFLPERTTDFIFAVFSEEFGFIGILFLLSIYIFIMIRGLYIGIQAQDTFSRLLAGSIIMTFFVYVFVNIGMVIGILPVVGIPLPLISYGGTSLVTIMLSFGILMSIHNHRSLVRK